MTSIYDRTFTAGEVVAAADITMSTLQNWLKRGVIVGHRKIEGGGEKGKHRRFSWSNVMEVCTAARLVHAGISDLKIAFFAGMEFGHTGPGELPGAPGRMPAMPFDVEHGRTMLFVSGERSAICCWSPGKDVLSDARYHLGNFEAVIVIDLLEMFDRACVALDLHPQAVMDEAYSQKWGE